MAHANLRRPAPTPTTTSQRFWDCADAGSLQLQYCGACGEAIFYPRPRCPLCWGADLAWREVSGFGVVASYTVVHRPGHPAFTEDAPFVVALIDLREGPRMLSNVVGCASEEVRVGLPVAVHWTKRGDFTLPQFVPSRPEDEEDPR